MCFSSPSSTSHIHVLASPSCQPILASASGSPNLEHKSNKFSGRFTSSSKSTEDTNADSGAALTVASRYSQPSYASDIGSRQSRQRPPGILTHSPPPTHTRLQPQFRHQFHSHQQAQYNNHPKKSSHYSLTSQFSPDSKHYLPPAQIRHLSNQSQLESPQVNFDSTFDLLLPLSVSPKDSLQSHLAKQTQPLFSDV
ncbi:unnamed protein product [Protopolystoma xenopodis]|uniref:Uncharacterized protein n=1 Tax=Protopolystoma xenopodis TaxID=117903 RepID=A0A3S5BCB9_9PLAT|nr:unnamed protein product [Protopolystoma xenopodis]